MVTKKAQDKLVPLIMYECKEKKKQIHEDGCEKYTIDWGNGVRRNH